MVKLMTLWDFKVTPVNGWFIIDLFELAEPGRLKSWNMAHGSYDGYVQHMNSLTDELCEGFFPKPKKTKEEKKALKAAAKETQSN